MTFTSAFVGYSQSVFVNPYSSFGIGNQILPTDAIQASLGGSSIAFSDSTMVSYLNSANIANVTKGYPLFSLGINGRLTEFSEGSSTYNRGFVSLDHMILAIPFKRRYGVAFGLSPYARRGYSFESKINNDGDTSIFEYNGKGSISKGFLGLSYKIIDQKGMNLSIGTNLGYLFGTTTNSRRSSLSTDNTAVGLALQSDRLQSFHYDFSLSAGYTLKDTNNLKSQIQLNAYYDPSQKLTGTFADETFYIGSSNVILLESLNTDATYISASSLRIGAKYTTQFQRSTKKNKTYRSELAFIGEYNSTLYSQFRKDYSGIADTSYTGDYARFSFGVQYTPNLGYWQSVDKTGFWNKMKYRAGTYLSTLPYQHGGEYFTQFGTTFGIGIPMMSSNAYSTLNLGVDLGTRTNGVTGALNERYIGFNIGIIIAPTRADYWFRKVKLD